MDITAKGILRALCVLSDILYPKRQPAITAPVREALADGQACVQYHRSWLHGEHYDWRIGCGRCLRGYSTAKLPSLGETVTAFSLEDRSPRYLRFSGIVADDDLGAGEVELLEIASALDVVWSVNGVTFTFAGKRIYGRFTVVHELGKKCKFTRIA